MLSYQHAYHAGNYADVIKHLTLAHTLSYLVQKDKPMFYFESHAGRGRYDLASSESSKTAEWKDGIGRLWDKKAKLPAVFSPYIHAIETLNEKGKLRSYPGSPMLASSFLRPIDRAYLCELHPQEFAHLSHALHSHKRFHLATEEGIARMISMLPPPERRGLVVIDPSYEVKSEYQDIPRALKTAYERFSTGVFCLWYPIISPHHHTQLLRGLAQLNPVKAVSFEFYPGPLDTTQMNGCGMLILNPPFTLFKALKQAADFLCGEIYGKGAHYVLREEIIQAK